MPPALLKAHTDLDRALEKCYRPEPFHSDRERLELLFALYEILTAPVLPTNGFFLGHETTMKRSMKRREITLKSHQKT